MGHADLTPGVYPGAGAAAGLTADLASVGQATRFGGRMFAPWAARIPARGADILRLVVGPGAAVRASDPRVGAELATHGAAAIALRDGRTPELVVYARGDRAQAPSDARGVLDEALAYCAELSALPPPVRDVWLDELPAAAGFDGLSIPGAVFLARPALDGAHALTIAHEAAHQWWGPLRVGGGPAAALWTESLAEAAALLFLAERRAPGAAHDDARLAVRCHTALRSRAACWDDLRTDRAAFDAFVYGSAVLAYLACFARDGRSAFAALVRAHSAAAPASVGAWFAALAPASDRAAFDRDPVGALDRVIAGQRGALAALLSAPRAA